MNNQTNGQNPNGSVGLTVFNSITLQDLLSSQIESPAWLVDQLIPGNGIACIAGRPKVGKSFVVLELAASIASGEPLFGQFEVDKKNVLIISKEDGQAQLKERINKLNIDRSLSIAISTDQNIFFDDDSMLPKILNLVHQYDAQVVIIDSFIRINRGDENTSKGITLIHRVFKQLNDEGITIIFIHHHGKEDSQHARSGGDSLRGSSDIYAMIDTLMTLRKENEHTLLFSNDANRHSMPIKPFYVSFPDFSEDNYRFKFLGFSDGNSEQNLQMPIQKAMDKALKILSEQGMIHQADIIREMLGTDGKPEFGQTTIKNALKKLEITKQVLVVNEQNRKIYGLPYPASMIQAHSVERVEG